MRELAQKLLALAEEMIDDGFLDDEEDEEQALPLFELEAPTPQRGLQLAMTDFDRFWQAYPNKEAKAKCKAWWLKHRPDPEAVLAGVERWKGSQRWADGYIMGPHRWLSEGQWESQPKPARDGSVTQEAADQLFSRSIFGE